MEDVERDVTESSWRWKPFRPPKMTVAGGNDRARTGCD